MSDDGWQAEDALFRAQNREGTNVRMINPTYNEETLLPLSITALIEPGHLTWPQLIEKLTIRPAKILGIDRGTLKPGADADVTIIDPTIEWTIDVTKFASKSRNSPFAGQKVRGRAHAVIVSGEIKNAWPAPG